MSKVILHNPHTWLKTNPWGNAMFQYLVCKKIQYDFSERDVLISNFTFEPWNIIHDDVSRSPDVHKYISPCVGEHLIDMDGLYNVIDKIDDFNLLVVFQRLMMKVEYLPPLNLCRQIFNKLNVIQEDILDIISDKLVCPVRAGDVLNPIHPNYVLMPPQFYADMSEKYNKQIVFTGQIGDDDYSKMLMEYNPQAMVIKNDTAIQDFQLLLHSNHIVLPVSSFTWMAAYLSESLQIDMPLYGLFNKEQCPAPDFIPDDSRFTLWKFPQEKSKSLETVLNNFKTIQNDWTEITPQKL